MEGVVHGHGADAVLLGQPHALAHGLERDGLAELAVGVPAGDRLVARAELVEPRARPAPAGLGAEVLVEVQRLDRVVRLDAVPRRQLGEPRRGVGFVPRCSRVAVGRGYQFVVHGDRHH